MGAFSFFERELQHVQPVAASAADMPQAGPNPAVPHMGRVVALVDDTPAAANAAWRAALVARTQGVPLQLLHLHPERDSPDALHAQAQDLARRVQARLGVDVECSVRPGRPTELAQHLPAQAGLLVVPYQRRHLLVESIVGTLPERIFRCVSVPVLVVKRAAIANYRRVLVPVKLDADAVPMIRWARSLSRDPRPRVLHVLDTGTEQSLRIADAPERSLRMQRQRRCRQAYAELHEIITWASRDTNESAAAVITFGHAPSRVLEIARARHAQLVVVGKQHRSIFSELFDEGVPHRLVATGHADVLLHPLRARPAPEIDPWVHVLPIG